MREDCRHFSVDHDHTAPFWRSMQKWKSGKGHACVHARSEKGGRTTSERPESKIPRLKICIELQFEEGVHMHMCNWKEKKAIQMHICVHACNVSFPRMCRCRTASSRTTSTESVFLPPPPMRTTTLHQELTPTVPGKPATYLRTPRTSPGRQEARTSRCEGARSSLNLSHPSIASKET